VKTIRIRIAVAVGSSGAWNSCGWGGIDGNEKDDQLVSLVMEPMEDEVVRRYWVEFDVPVPIAETVNISAVTVTPAKEQPE
jgi:hypothetical protein